jgi:hypothetical protein
LVFIVGESATGTHYIMESHMEPTKNMETVEILKKKKILMFLTFTPRKLNKVLAAYIRVDYKIPTSSRGYFKNIE